ncbi:mitochondrial 37S ribosomal protein uS10m RSM10 [Sporobolomyces salmoneus]|uniref:mitochondrial 37S ribosomal protein uS10m RSM10 n=1 Tax=Sporobolomyces salmoneus TaxID=183962 RepID=UPI003181F036
MIRLPRTLLQVTRARYASTVAEASTSAPTPPPFSQPSSESTSTPPTSTPVQESTPASSVSSSSSSPSSSLPSTNSSDSELSPVFGRHVPLPQTHGVHVATLHLRSYTDSVPDLQFFTSFALRAAKALGLPTSGAVALPTRTSLFTVPRSPFAHKKSQQNFWRKEHKRAIKVWDGNEEIVNAWLAYLRKEALGGVGMKAQVFTYRPVGWGQELGKDQLTDAEGQLSAQEDELVGMVAGGDGAQVESLAKDLMGELEAEVEQSEQIEGRNEGASERRELEEVDQREVEAKVETPKEGGDKQ